MKRQIFDRETERRILKIQRNEITEYEIYLRLSKAEKNSENKKTLKIIANEEKEHYKFWKSHTKKELSPRFFRIWIYFLISRILGLTFGIKLMEKGEENAQTAYKNISRFIDVSKIFKKEQEHEEKLIKLINEQKLNYVGSIVLGLNDALVELTGALAGFTLALGDGRLIAIIGFITGIAASLSMAASEFLSSRLDGSKNAGTSAIYTGIAYIITVLILIMPYLIFNNPYFALALTLSCGVIIIFVFNFYVSVVKETSFWSRFFEMAAISLGVAAFTFGISYVVKAFFGINI